MRIKKLANSLIIVTEENHGFRLDFDEAFLLSEALPKFAIQKKEGKPYYHKYENSQMQYGVAYNSQSEKVELWKVEKVSEYTKVLEILPQDFESIMKFIEENCTQRREAI